MKLVLKIDKFLLELETDDEASALSLLLSVATLLQRHGVDAASNIISEKLAHDYKGKPGWTFTEKE
jgi:hypothetical protein